MRIEDDRLGRGQSEGEDLVQSFRWQRRERRRLLEGQGRREGEERDRGQIGCRGEKVGRGDGVDG